MNINEEAPYLVSSTSSFSSTSSNLVIPDKEKDSAILQFTYHQKDFFKMVTKSQLDIQHNYFSKVQKTEPMTSAVDMNPNLYIQIIAENIIILDQNLPLNTVVYCSLYLKNDESEIKWCLIDTMEVNNFLTMVNNQEQRRKSAFIIPYMFHKKQFIKFKVFIRTENNTDENNVKNSNCNINEVNNNLLIDSNINTNVKKLVGETTEVLLSSVSTNISRQSLKLELVFDEKIKGTLLIKHEQVQNCASLINCQIIGSQLKRSKWFFSNNPFFVISLKKKTNKGSSIPCLINDEAFTPLYKSEVNKKMSFKPFSIHYQTICGINQDDEDPLLRITFFDYRKNKKPKTIGYNDISFLRLSESIGLALPIFNETSSSVGSFKIIHFSIQQKNSFYDYLKNGFQLNFITAIDFTASNKDPTDLSSYHFISYNNENNGNFYVGKLNPYEKCVKSIGEILCSYDKSQNFCVLGFGAKNNGKTDHCFPLNLNFDQHRPFVNGIKGIFDIYRKSVNQLTFSGPTLLSPVIKYASQIAISSFEKNRSYSVLLIITDGIANDLQDMTDVIIDAGRIPLSLIIVGIGDSDFSSMEVLNSKDAKYYKNKSGRKLDRNFIQFVPMKKYLENNFKKLAKTVLKDIPNQLVEWAEMNGIKPSNI